MMRTLAIFLLALLLAAPNAAAETTIPGFWDSRERLVRPDLSGVTRLRFLTTIDFPPFNALDGEGRLSGFHVDLARAICAELDLSEQCQIQALPWAELPEALATGQGEAIIAGIGITAETRRRYAFSRPYLQLPARFIMARATAVDEPLVERLAGKSVGVAAGSVHERILRELFPEVRVVTYSRAEWMLGDLKDGKTDAVFGDGMRLSFWIAGSASNRCCRFVGGPYLLPAWLGTGMAIAARPDDEKLVAAFDYALREINANGVFGELYLRYFPISYF
jgi:polar amino acid transport system substrate-binding protein